MIFYLIYHIVNDLILFHDTAEIRKYAIIFITGIITYYFLLFKILNLKFNDNFLLLLVKNKYFTVVILDIIAMTYIYKKNNIKIIPLFKSSPKSSLNTDTNTNTDTNSDTDTDTDTNYCSGEIIDNDYIDSDQTIPNQSSTDIDKQIEDLNNYSDNIKEEEIEQNIKIIIKKNI
jgi:hypothetical protein